MSGIYSAIVLVSVNHRQCSLASLYPHAATFFSCFLSADEGAHTSSRVMAMLSYILRHSRKIDANVFL